MRVFALKNPIKLLMEILSKSVLHVILTVIKIKFKYKTLREGLKKTQLIIHVLWIRGRGGYRMWISKGGGGGAPHMDKKKSLMLNF